ncbi:hypothetical protein [Cellulosimicrobium sp. Marseille-Q4280]|uniref:hypothetical protein n=1 Tax=Cellulosimicrobium sp. Marseille-Q4280 TaxID=2937992 RepID=UPI00203EBEFA|nr:hypothetical protein [Cellulosimicrobium sp. Marseille-Q4280]
MTLDLPLGTTVTVSNAAVLVRRRRGEGRTWERTLPLQHDRLGARTGIIVGHRTLANGSMSGGGYEWESGITEPDHWTADEHLDAYLVATGTRTALVRVLPGDLQVTSAPARAGLGARVLIDANAELVKTGTDVSWDTPFDPDAPDERRWTAVGAEYGPRPMIGFVAGTRTLYDTDVRRPSPYAPPTVTRRGTHAVTLVAVHPRLAPLRIPTDQVAAA